MIDALDAIITARFLVDLAALFLWGTGAYVWLLVPRALGDNLWRRTTNLRAAAAVVLVLGIGVQLPVRAAMFGDGWSDATNPSLLWTILAGTNVGTALLVQMAAALALSTSFVWRAGSGPALTTIASAALLGGMVLTGHAVMNDGVVRLVQQASTLLHLLAGGAWLGALPAVSMTVRWLHDEAWRSPAMTALMRFSAAGHAAVSLVVLSGIANALLILKGQPIDLGSTYQRLLVVKAGLVVLMIAIALCNRYVIVPRLKSRRAADALVVATLAEIVIALAVLALVAWFGMLEPTAR